MKRLTIFGTTLVTFALGMALAVLVAGSASASGKTTTKKKTTTTTSLAAPPPTATTVAPADKFSAINGTVNAASDHEIVGSSAFPNFTTGAVDNYYTLAHAHVDNSPFAEGTSSPFDTGPVGQTAAAGNFQQPQYADARWPGGPDTASYGSQGGPYATSAADNNRATADASEPSNGFSGPGLHGTKTIAVPKGFDAALRQALGTWKGAWSGRLGLKKAAAPKLTTTTPRLPVTVPTVPSSPVTAPSVTTPNVAGVNPPVTVPKLPSAGAMGGTRSPAAVTTPRPPVSLPTPKPKAPAPSAGGTESLLKSSTLATLVYKTGDGKPDTSKSNTCKSDTVATTGTTGTTATTTTTEKPKSDTCTLVLSGESSMGRVSIAGGQIVIEGIHVTASITNDGTTPSYQAAVSVASATIGGIPVTIDQSGVHVAGQGQGLPYQQASNSLNTALKQAGIQIFLVQPEVTSCNQSGTDGGSGTTTTTSTTTSTDQSGASSSCGQSGAATSSCAQSSSTGSGGGVPGVPAPPTSTQSSTSTTPSSSCGQTAPMGSCDQTGTSTYGGTTTATTTTTAAPTPSPSPTPGATTTTNQSSTTTTSGPCDQSGMTSPSSSCTQAGTPTSTTTSSNDQSAMTTSTNSTAPMSGGTFQFGPGPGTDNSGEETVTATGVHIVFTQPVSPSGVPAQFVEHILGEVFVDSLASPAAPLPNIGYSGAGSSSLSSSSSCLGSGHSSKTASGGRLSMSGGGGGTAGGSLSAAGSGSSGSVSPSSASSLGSASQPTTGSTGNTLPARFASALHKPLWLLLGYLVWQLLVVGTGWSLWNWRRGGAS